MNDTFFRRLGGFAAITAALGVVVGAFGAHSLKSRIPIESLEVLKTGVIYLFIHALACLFIVALPRTERGVQWLKFSGMSFMAGIVLFSGSLFVISTQSLLGFNIGPFGIVTPIGGLCFIGGWIGLSAWCFRSLFK